MFLFAAGCGLCDHVTAPVVAEAGNDTESIYVTLNAEPERQMEPRHIQVLPFGKD